MRQRAVFWLALAASLLTACEDSYSYSGKLILDGQHRVRRDETLNADLWVTGGQVFLESGSRVTGSVYVVWDGAVQADGEILGNVTMLDGALTLGPQAQVGGDLLLGGGTVNRSPEAVISGTVNESLPLPSGQSALPTSWATQWPWATGNALALAVVAFALARFAPGRAARVAQAEVRHPIVAAAMGLLAGIVGLALLVQMAFTIVLIPVTLLGLLLLLFALTLGWAAAGLALGEWLVERRRWALTPPWAAALGTFVLMLLVNALGWLPGVGGLVPLTAVAISLGAVVLTRFGMHNFAPADTDTLSPE